MRIKFIVTNKIDMSSVNYGLYECLINHFAEDDNMEIVDDKEDVVHAFGLWNHTWTNKVRRIRKREVPIIFTCLSGASSLYNTSGNLIHNRFVRKSITNIVNANAMIHSCGKYEKEALQRIAPNANVSIIHNPNFTKSVTIEDTLGYFIQLYKQVINDNDIKIFDDIESNVSAKLDKSLCNSPVEYTNIVEIATRIIYLQHLYNKRAIPQSYLDEISECMTSYDYNEKLMNRLLHDMNKYQLASYVMALLSSASTLTEGFMPVPLCESKIVENMRKCIYNNIK